MPYANNGSISQAPLEGGIEITEQQYAQALAGMLDGKVVRIDNGFSVEEAPEDAADEPDVPQPRIFFSVREFRQRFTLEEQVGIRQATMTDMEVGLVYDDFQSAQFIDVTDPAVARGIDLYIAKGLLDATRKAELLAPEEPT